MKTNHSRSNFVLIPVISLLRFISFRIRPKRKTIIQKLDMWIWSKLNKCSLHSVPDQCMLTTKRSTNNWLDCMPTEQLKRWNSSRVSLFPFLFSLARCLSFFPSSMLCAIVSRRRSMIVTVYSVKCTSAQ